MGNTDKKESKKFRRKIRIRLADPNIPDSYICEIFDNSLENEEDGFSKNDNILHDEGKVDPSKPKNYFDLLMSKSCRKNGVIKTIKERNGYRIVEDTYDDEAFQKKKQNKQSKSQNSVSNSVDSKSKEIKYEFVSSENKSFLQIQRQIGSEEFNVNQENDFEKDVEVEEELESENLVTIFDSSKIDLTRKKTLSILNYFSKREISPKNNLKVDKLKECSAGDLKTNQTKNSLQYSVKSDLKKLCKDGGKQVVLNGINKENLKLAPLFCRKKDNYILDSVRQKARHEFLYKGSQSAVKKSETKTTERIFHFPIVTHVQQRNESLYWSLRQVCLPFQKVCSSECAFKAEKKFHFQIKQSDVVNEAVLEDKIIFNKELLCKIKCKYLELNLDSVIDGLKDHRDRFAAQVKKLEKKKINSSEASNGNLGFEELNILWTEKYKPKSSEVLGNANTVRKLTKWLQSWKSFNNELKELASCNQRSKDKQSGKDDDDEDEDEDVFFDFTNEKYGLKAPGNVCIISGPNGCGKSALVYALACELEFNVLELNASSKRTGKKVLSDLQEATQSHKVHRVNLLQHVTVEEMAKNKKVKQKRYKKSELAKPTHQEEDSKMSLILIEDADIVFEDHDEGFYSAITSLVQTSKRPLIFLTNEPNFAHVENMKTDQCLKLEMEPPNFYISCAVLDMVSSMEGVHFEKEILEFLLRQNSFDLRKSLLELQFWIGSGRNIKNVQRAFDLGHLWWGLSKFLFNQDMMHPMKFKGRKRKRAQDLFDPSDEEVESAAKKFKSNPYESKDSYSGKTEAFTEIADSSIDSYFRVLDLASTLDEFWVTGNQEPLPGNECRLKDSVSLCESMEEVLWGKRLTEELSDEMMNLSARIFSKRFKEEEIADRKLNFVSPCWEEVRWRNSQAKASAKLSELVSLHKRGEKRSLHLDYLPSLRNICRVEKHRSEINPKRKNRFYHYLNNLGPELSEENLEINCEVFNR